MNARHIILTIAALAILAAPAAVLAQQGPGPGAGEGTCEGTGPGAGSGTGSGMGAGRSFHGHGHGRHHDDGVRGLGFFDRRLPRLAERLGLSDEQVEQIQAIVDEARPTMDEYAEQLRVEREAYREANDDPRTFDEGAFLTHAAAMHEIQTALGVVVGQTKANVFGVLTDEQIEQLGEMRDNFEGRSRRGGGRRSSS
jgi:Spy/CpxP family protein refolding chaperone